MDFLNNAYAQLAELFRTMTPGAKITAGLLLVVVVVSVGYLFTHEMSGPSADLMHGLPISASQLPAMEAAFAKANLKGYEVRGTQIRVPRGQEAAYMAALAEAKALPPNFGSAMRDAINSGNVFDSSKQREQRIKIATQDELGLIISSMSGIERAYVLYDVDSKPGFNKDKIITATATVKSLGSEQLDEAKVSSIRHLVAGAIAGLKPENVTVSDLNGRTWAGDPDNGGGAGDNLYVSLKRTYEQDLRAKILNALSFIPNVTVEPTVTLDTKKLSRTREVKHDPKTTVIRQSDQSSSQSQTSAGPAGRVGFVAQQPNTGASLAANNAGGAREEQEQSKSEMISLASGQEIETETVGLTPKLAKVSVGIPLSYFKKVWQQRNPVEEGKEQKGPDQAALEQIRTEESSKIQKHVAQLLPLPEGVNDPLELVTVTTFQDIPGKEIPAPNIMQMILAWLSEYWSMLGMIVVALVSLMMLRSLIRAAPALEQPRAAPRIAVAGTTIREEDAEETIQPTATPLKRFVAGPSLRDELSKMVKDDPDIAANILRGWIGSAT